MALPLLPVYLLVDTSGDRAAPDKLETVNRFLPAVAARLQHDAILAARVQLSLIDFGGTAWTALGLSAPADVLRHPPPVSLTNGRSYAAALREVRRQMSFDLEEMALKNQPCHAPLVVFLTDGPPGPDDEGNQEHAELRARHPETKMIPVWYSAAAPPRWLPESPPGIGCHRVPPGADDPVRVTTEIVWDHAARVLAAARPAPSAAAAPVVAAPVVAAPRPRHRAPEPLPEPAPEPAPPPQPDAPEWTGAFTPFSVGHPGKAAGEVRPIPDVTEWDRRDTVLDGVCLRDEADEPALELRAASVRGLSHRFYGTARQDDYAFRCTADRRYLVAAVSDGVSNSKLSHQAATLVARVGSAEVARMLAERPPEELDWAGVMRLLADQIVALGTRLLERPADSGPLGYRAVAKYLAATALFAVVGLRPVDGETPVHVFAVGDSPAWVLRGGKVWEPLQRIKNEGNEIASSRTHAVPLKRDGFDPPVATTLRPGDVLVLMTDGVGDPLGDGSGSVGRFLAHHWARPPAPVAFAAQVDFARRSHDDDRTALAIWPE